MADLYAAIHSVCFSEFYIVSRHSISWIYGNQALLEFHLNANYATVKDNLGHNFFLGGGGGGRGEVWFLCIWSTRIYGRLNRHRYKSSAAKHISVKTLDT